MFNAQDYDRLSFQPPSTNIQCNVVYISERRQFGALLDTVNRSKLNMPYEILEKATNYFNDANKLGQGGSGSVYKVTPDPIIHFGNQIIDFGFRD